jgi:hypothetical protein
VWSGLYVFHLYGCNIRALSLYQGDPSRSSDEATVYKRGVEQPQAFHLTQMSGTLLQNNYEV